MAWQAGFALHRAGNATSVILTLSATDTNANNAIDRIKQQAQKIRDRTFGPFPDLYQERKINIDAEECFESMEIDDEIIPIDQAFTHCTGIANVHVRDSMQRWCKKRQYILGHESCQRDEIGNAVHEAFQNKKRYARGSNRTRQVMTIHQAKNREFDNVVVLWTYSLAGDASDEYKRRLLYNAITRAKRSCTVIVLGPNRLNNHQLKLVG